MRTTAYSVDEMRDIINSDLVETEPVETEPVETEPVETEPVFAPVLRSPSVIPAVTNQVTNGTISDSVISIAEKIIVDYPHYEYMLFSNDNNSFILILAQRFDDSGQYDILTGDVMSYHIYRSTYLPNNPATTYFLDYLHLDTTDFVIDDDTEHYLYYASFGNNPRLSEVVQNAEIYSGSLWHVLLPCIVCSIILQQIFRRFG